jgi:predicted Holliday junction resolvase-like endonuclease
MSILEIGLSIILIFSLLMSWIIVKCLSENLEREQKDKEKLTSEISDLKSKTKSTEVRTGQIAEQFAPYLKDFPYDAKDVRFLGSPIDMIVFDFKGDQVVLIEFKTGDSKESARQRQIREMIKNGRCIYQVIRVKEEVSIRTADPNSGTFSYE